MKFMKSLKYIMLLVILLLAACGNDETADHTPEDTPDDAVEGTITVSAAASLVDALEEVTERFNEAYPDVQVDFNFGGSGALMQQILQGAPADLFFSANKSHFEEVVDGGYIDQENT